VKHININSSSIVSGTIAAFVWED